jgi:hypothetical protein
MVKDALKLGVDMAFFGVEKLLPRQTGDAGVYFELFAGFFDIPAAVGYLATGGNGWSGAGGIVGGLGDMLRLCRLEEFIVEAEGISLLVLVSTDVVGNLLEAGLTVGSAA